MQQYKQLTSGVRYQIYGLKQAGLNQTKIAKKFGIQGPVDTSSLSIMARSLRSMRKWQQN